MSGADGLIASIQDSQTSEQELLKNLDTLTSQPGFNVNNTGVQSVINSIQSLSDSRISMFNALSSQAKTLQSGVANSRVDLVSQMTLLNVVEEQLDQAKKSINTLQGQNDSKKRMVEVNTYYGQRYEAQSILMKLIIFICAPLLILFILKKKSLLPPTISNWLIGITMAVGGFFIVRASWDISTRSNMNFDEYDWNFENPAGQIPTVMDYNKAHLFNFDNPIKTLVGNLGLCVGSDCCANGLYFDTTKQKCTTINTGAGGTSTGSNASGATAGAQAQAGAGAAKVESFVCGKNNSFQATNVAVIDYDEEKQNGISPFSYSSTYAPIA